MLREGENGVFSQSWFPLCLSADVGPGSVVGVDFLGGRVAVYRGAAGGPARVLSAYCAHVGADLSVGDVVGERLRCRFHRWEYEGSGLCAATGIGDPVPRGARLFRFPSVERHGIVWAFNGDKPLFDFPRLPYPDDELEERNSSLEEMPVEPWLVNAHTMDLQHLSQSHDFTLDADPGDSVHIDAHCVGFHLKATMRSGERFDVAVDIHGTNIFLQTGTVNGRWCYWLTGLTIPRPGHSRAFFAYGVRRGEGDAAGTRAFLDNAHQAMLGLYHDDTPILGSIRFRPGLLTRSDRALARYLDYLRDHPRANPAHDFIT
ncbi:Rieske 2Fe-2S domain-containing protein [Streptomyces sp. NPDC049585]|uniref:Rieske 2Fe-2S domain-containing protein n=1 Tax=Streptomyces sp. NPDC049585 TaxID=3155154 RepID=UPI0034365ACD